MFFYYGIAIDDQQRIPLLFGQWSYTMSSGQWQRRGARLGFLRNAETAFINLQAGEISHLVLRLYK